MRREDTKDIILEKALELFSQHGYDSVSVGEIAKAVGIKAPSLYNHYPSKRAIFDAIVETTAQRYKDYTNGLKVHVENSRKDIGVFSDITEDALVEKVRNIFVYSLRDEEISRFRRMMAIEQFRSPELSKLYSERYVDRMITYHAGIFRGLITGGELKSEDPETLSLMYVSPVITLLGVCDRQPDREAECLEKLDTHVRLFYRTFNTGARILKVK